MLEMQRVSQECLFGRLPSSGIQLEHLSASRAHAQLSTDGAGNLFLTDLGSGAALVGQEGGGGKELGWWGWLAVRCTSAALMRKGPVHPPPNLPPLPCPPPCAPLQPTAPTWMAPGSKPRCPSSCRREASSSLAPAHGSTGLSSYRSRRRGGDEPDVLCAAPSG